MKLTNIYKIINTDTNEVVYVGKSMRDINKRFDEHKKDDNHLTKQTYLIKNNCKIVLIEQVLPELAAGTEQYYIDYYSPILNRNNAEYIRMNCANEAMKRAKKLIKEMNKKQKDKKFESEK